MMRREERRGRTFGQIYNRLAESEHSSHSLGGRSGKKVAAGLTHPCSPGCISANGSPPDKYSSRLAFRQSREGKIPAGFDTTLFAKSDRVVSNISNRKSNRSEYPALPLPRMPFGACRPIRGGGRV